MSSTYQIVSHREPPLRRPERVDQSGGLRGVAAGAGMLARVVWRKESAKTNSVKRFERGHNSGLYGVTFEFQCYRRQRPAYCLALSARRLVLLL